MIKYDYLTARKRKSTILLLHHHHPLHSKEINNEGRAFYDEVKCKAGKVPTSPQTEIDGEALKSVVMHLHHISGRRKRSQNSCL